MCVCGKIKIIAKSVWKFRQILLSDKIEKWPSIKSVSKKFIKLKANLEKSEHKNIQGIINEYSDCEFLNVEFHWQKFW